MARRGVFESLEEHAIGDWDEEVVLGVLIHSATVFLAFKADRHFSNEDA